MRERIPDTTKIWTEEDARRVFDVWRRSGESLAAFARRHGLTEQRMYWWRRRLSTPTEPTTTALTLVPATVIGGDEAGIVIRLPTGVAIEVANATPSWIAAVVNELSRSAL
jgi:hypothetical protein